MFLSGLEDMIILINTHTHTCARQPPNHMFLSGLEDMIITPESVFQNIGEVLLPFDHQFDHQRPTPHDL